MAAVRHDRSTTISISSISGKDIRLSDKIKGARPLNVPKPSKRRFHGFKQGLSTGVLPLLKIDWKVESLCGYPFKCFLDACKGYPYIQMAESDEEKTVGQNIEVYVDDLVIKSHTEAEMLRDIDETFRTRDKTVPRQDRSRAATPVPIRKSLPLFKTLKKCIKKSDFHWTPEAEQAFKKLKAISAVLTTERNMIQTPVYFVSHVLQGPELNYTPMEKLVLALVFAAKRATTKMEGHAGRTQYHIPAEDICKRTDPSRLPYRKAERNPTRYISGRNPARAVDTIYGRIIMQYEALIAGLWITAKMGVRIVHVSVDSKLVANQVLGTYVAKEENMINYLEKAESLKEVATIVEEDEPTWMEPIIEYLKDGALPDDRNEARKLRIKARQYELLEGVLYRRSFLRSWLRCVRPLQVDYVIRKIHEGSCSMHAGPWSVVAKAMRLRYYWPTMHQDAWDTIRKCNNCHINHPVPRNPQQPLTPITAPWPFYKWGINIAGPFLVGPGKIKFLIVAMGYFTKWIEAKAVATITGSQSNGLVERANRSLGEGIKACLGEGNKNWIEELPHVLWAHRTMIKSSHDDTLFSLTYGTKAVIPAKIRMPMYHTAVVDAVLNDEELWLNLDLLEERRERAAIREAKAKLKMKKYYNARVRGINFRLGDFVEGPYEVTEALEDGAYKLRSLDGAVLPQT
ncbi:reverse transcriptase domain-containing protein [Tanacetum coccineum]